MRSAGKVRQMADWNRTIYETAKEEETYQVGFQLGKNAKPGEVYCLVGDLGTGKTVFTQGFANGLGITGAVNSPTFTIVQEYKEGRIPLYHFDVYRIADEEEMEEIGYEDYFYGNGVCLVEWANLIPDLLPEQAVLIRLERDRKKSENYRKIIVVLDGEKL